MSDQQGEAPKRKKSPLYAKKDPILVIHEDRHHRPKPGHVTIGAACTLAIIAATRWMAYAIQHYLEALPDKHAGAYTMSLGFIGIAVVLFVLAAIGRWLDRESDTAMFSIVLLMLGVILGSWAARIMTDPFYPKPVDDQQIIRELRRR